MTLHQILKPEDVLKMNLAQLLGLTVGDFNRSLTSKEFRHFFEQAKALWIYTGKPDEYHAELTSGMCSDGFIDTLKLLSYTNFCKIMAAHLVHQFRRCYSDKIDWVIGSDHAGATISYEVACLLNARHDFTEKGENKAQVWKRFEIEPGEVVLQVEELVTTTGTLRAVRNGIIEGTTGHKVDFHESVLTLVHRSDEYTLNGGPIIFGEHYNIHAWKQSDCPLCAKGSKRIKPKGIKNWEILTGTQAA